MEAAVESESLPMPMDEIELRPWLVPKDVFIHKILPFLSPLELFKFRVLSRACYERFFEVQSLTCSNLVLGLSGIGRKFMRLQKLTLKNPSKNLLESLSPESFPSLRNLTFECTRPIAEVINLSIPTNPKIQSFSLILPEHGYRQNDYNMYSFKLTLFVQLPNFFPRLLTLQYDLEWIVHPTWDSPYTWPVKKLRMALHPAALHVSRIVFPELETIILVEHKFSGKICKQFRNRVVQEMGARGVLCLME